MQNLTGIIDKKYFFERVKFSKILVIKFLFLNTLKFFRPERSITVNCPLVASQDRGLPKEH